eukprot:365687-Chlamydomonas_euryale.AAC.7
MAGNIKILRELPATASKVATAPLQLYHCNSTSMHTSTSNLEGPLSHTLLPGKTTDDTSPLGAPKMYDQPLK